jgi:hypothetical protein
MKTKIEYKSRLIEVYTAGTFQKTSRIDLVSNSKDIVVVMHLSQPESQPKHLDHYG